MNKFKVGDKVRVKAGKSVSSKVHNGRICTVAKVEKLYVTLEEEFEINGVWLDEIELVEEKMSELEELVKKANEIPKILSKIRKHCDVGNVEFGMKDGNKIAFEKLAYETIPSILVDGNDGDVFHIKPKIKFEPFTVGKGWEVKLEGEALHIGCRNYKASMVKSAFEILCSGKMGAGTFYATRGGIVEAGEGVTWEEAEKILTALEKAGVE